MSNLKPSMIGLDKGLNLQVAKIVAPQGSVLDTLNYEQVDFQGQKRIEGFTRFDGGQMSALDEYHIVTLEGLVASWEVNDLIASETGMFGVVAKMEDVAGNTLLYIALNNINNLPKPGTLVYRIIDGESISGTNFLSVEAGVSTGVLPSQHYNNLIELNAALRNRVEELPGPVAGLHWFRDRLHAMAGVVYLSLEGLTPVIYPGDVLTVDTTTSKVLDSVVLGNTRAVFLDSMTPAPWAIEGGLVSRDGLPVGAVANGYEALTIEEIASIFEARSEELVLSEDGPTGPYNFGWRFKHLGWKVFFDNGISLYGDLTALNQNIEGVGTLGPTPTGGNNGSPAALNQGVVIAGLPAQVNGWKSSASNLTYNLTPSDVAEMDNVVTYADAYISWNAGTGAVIGDTGTPQEYSPNNTVRIG